MNEPTEYRIGNAIVRIHGKPPKQETLENACIRFARAVEAVKSQTKSNAS